MMISLKEYYEVVQESEAAIKAKQNPICKARGRPCKNALRRSIEVEEG
jgi:hypothetical protein